MPCQETWDWEHKEGDELPVVAATLYHRVRGQRAPLDLDGCTVTIPIAHLKTGVVVVAAAAVTVDDAPAGEVSYLLPDAVKDVPGGYRVEFRVTNADGQKARLPTRGFLRLRVGAGLG
jgi:hypothetical protein